MHSLKTIFFALWLPLILIVSTALPVIAQERRPWLAVFSEYERPDPFGRIVEKDRINETSPENSAPARAATLDLRAARNGYASFHLTANLPAAGPYTLSIQFPKLPQVETELYRAWYHPDRAKQKYWPDALIPVKAPYQTSMPDPENKIPNQTSQVFWVDLWIPRDAPPGIHAGEATLQTGAKRTNLKIRLEILQAEIPDEDALTIDHNSYGSTWIGDLYPQLREREGEKFYSSDAFFGLIHAYHRIFYEHRGTFHQLGYGHAGKVGPEFAPALTGSGREKRIANWDLFDRHYGPLLDGGAFARTRRGAQPIPFVYLPINPEWPASFLSWGEPGYEAEFVNVVRAMEEHFRSKGWTRTKFEMFFNHKKRYKGFPWDGDETRFAKDDAPFREYKRLLDKAVPAGSPVQFVYRIDASWRLEDQFKSLAGVINFWVSSGTILSWLPEQLETVKKRGDIVWTYAGPPAIQEESSAILEHSLRAWIWDINGYIHWLTVSPSADPWFDSKGEGTALVYPGERFGIDGPIPSIRLKIQRNLLQDIAILKALEKTHSPEILRAEVCKRINGGEPKDWRLARPAMADKSPEEWSNATIDQAAEPYKRRFQNWKPDYWRPVREYILELADGRRPQ